KTLPEEVGEVFRNSQPCAFHVVNYRGHQAARRLVLKEPDRLAYQLRIDFISQVGDRAMPHGLNQPIAKKFGYRLDGKNNQKRNRNDGPDIMNPRREEMVQINRFVNAGYREKRECRIGGRGVQDAIDDRYNQEDDEALD